MNRQINPCIHVDKHLIDVGYTLLDTSKQNELGSSFLNLIYSLENLPPKLISEAEKNKLINNLFEELSIIRTSTRFLRKGDIKESYSLLFSKTVNTYLKIIGENKD